MLIQLYVSAFLAQGSLKFSRKLSQRSHAHHLVQEIYFLSPIYQPLRGCILGRKKAMQCAPSTVVLWLRYGQPSRLDDTLGCVFIGRACSPARFQPASWAPFFPASIRRFWCRVFPLAGIEPAHALPGLLYRLSYNGILPRRAEDDPPRRKQRKGEKWGAPPWPRAASGDLCLLRGMAW